MSTGTIISCNWPSAKELVEDIHAAELNVTTIIAQCANVCELAFKSKRTEMSGPGIMISSLILAPLFFFFGVMFPGIIWLINNSSTAKVAPSTIVLRKIQTQMFKTSGFIMVSFLVAAISTYKNNQDPSIMELKLISTLVTSQLWYISIMICLGNADRIINKTESVNDLRLYYYALFIAHLETLDHIKIPYKSVCKTLAKECHNDYEFNAISWIMDGRRISRLATITFCASAGLLVILGLGIVLAPGFLARLWKMWGKILSWLKRYSGIILYLFAIKLYVFIISANAYELAFVRSLVIETGGVQPAGEEKWGYGQTTAILLWFPFFFSAIKETIKYMKNPLRPETPQAEMESLEKGESPPEAGMNDLATYGSTETSSGHGA